MFAPSVLPAACGRGAMDGLYACIGVAMGQRLRDRLHAVRRRLPQTVFSLATDLALYRAFA